MSIDNRELKNLFNRIGGAMLFFLLAFNVIGGGVSVFGSWLTQINHSTAVHVIAELLNAAAYIASFTIPVWFFYAISKKKVIQPMGLSLMLSEKNTALTSASMMFLGTATCFSASYVNSLLFPISEEASEIYFSSDIRGGYALVLMFISTAIIPAFVEELLFRGVILSNIRPYSEGGAILISALLFGLMHQTPFQLFYATAIGVILGIIRVKTGSIWTGILVHFFNNFLSVLQTYLLECYDVQTGNVVYTVITLSVIVIGIVLGAVLYTVNLKNSTPKSVETVGFFNKPYVKQTRIFFKREDASVYKAFFSPTVIAFTVLSVLTMISTAAMINGV